MDLMFRFTLLCSMLAMFVANAVSQERIEAWTGKTIMVVTPHPDDDLFGCGGTLALLARTEQHHCHYLHKRQQGFYDLEMTSERLAKIRKAEEEMACETLGIPKESFFGSDITMEA